MTRRQARSQIFKLLYEMDLRGTDAQNVLKDSAKTDDYVADTITGTYNNIDEIDRCISKYLKQWEISRLNKVDLALLRFSVYELKYSDIKSAITINETVELAKKYSTEKSAHFINGLLGAFVRGENLLK